MVSEMSNNVVLTDDELCIIQSSLDMSIAAYNNFIENNGEIVLDSETRKAIKEMKQLRNRFLKEYF